MSKIIFFLIAIIFISCSQEKKPANESYLPGDADSFEYLEVSGSYEEIGHKIGEQFKDNINYIIKSNEVLASEIEKIQNDPEKLKLSNKLLEITTDKFPQYIEELKGMAKGAGVSFDILWMLNIRYELGITKPIDKGNSTIIYNGTDDTWLTHNIDEVAYFDNQLYVVKVSPPSGVEFYSVVLPSLLPGSGPSININGLVHTNNFIFKEGSEIGVPKSILTRAILESETLNEAKKIATMNPRAFPDHHNLLTTENGDYLSIELLPEGKFEVTSPNGLFLYTNKVIEQESNLPDAKSKLYSTQAKKRLASLNEVINPLDKNTNHDSPDTMLERLSKHDHDEFTPCRHPSGLNTAQTLGTALFNLKNNSMKLFKGFPCEAIPDSNYTVYSF